MTSHAPWDALRASHTPLIIQIEPRVQRPLSQPTTPVPLINTHGPLLTIAAPSTIEPPAPQPSPHCHLPTHGRCCCTCIHHCKDGGPYCFDDLDDSKPVSYICTAPLANGQQLAYSNWPAHHLCEAHEENRP